MAKEPTATPQPRGDGMVPTTQVAAVLMITKQRLGQLQSMGYIPRSQVRGHVSLVGAVQGYIKFLKDEERKASKVASESRVRDARARELELRISEREGRLIDINDVVAFETDVLGQLRANLSSLAARVTRDLDLREKIDRELNDILATCQRRFQEAERTVWSGSEADNADQGADAG